MEEADGDRLDPLLGIAFASACTSPSFSGFRTSPLALIRSVTSKVSSRGISGLGR